ncbi:hypothetical protein I9Y31_003416 [Clostridium perfringens]|nr:hypothetical protein [Clostridium perfringens]
MFSGKNKIKEDEKKKVKVVSLISILITVFINLVAYKYLPDNIALQTNGQNVVPKIIFVFIFPCLSIIVNFFNLKINNRSSLNAILTSILLLVVNILIIALQF